MSRTVRITPAGRLVLEPAPDEQPRRPDALAAEIDAAFEESSADGLLCLASRALDAPLPPALVFWRDIGRRFFHALRHAGANLERHWSRLEPPPDDEFHTVAAAAPPMRGLEYVTPELLSRLWLELRDLAVANASRHPEGPEGWLRSVNPVWHLLGRVTFHLAENKRNAERPFAFLATYTHRVSAGAKLQHLPLAQALKEYAGARSQATLASLLEPVRRAADESPLVRELLDTRALFQPQAWPIRQAYRFLTEVPRMEAAGLVVRVPDWWSVRRPARPLAQVRIGRQPASALGMDSLLDFSVEVAIDGEPLSEAELRQILDASEGLVLLRGRWVEVDRQQLEQALDHWRMLEAEHPDGISFIQGMRLLAGAPLDGDADIAATADWSNVVAGEWLRELLQTLREPGGVTDLEPG
ncbi:MAG TPA: SNF2 helicase-associated domain-containing protein, partial [Planctomycetaceae bacterium]|nr:SNF2 helicase-associated domain-containing protein [Planctomycetaceae bacterium]